MEGGGNVFAFIHSKGLGSGEGAGASPRLRLRLWDTRSLNWYAAFCPAGLPRYAAGYSGMMELAASGGVLGGVVLGRGNPFYSA